MTTHSLWSVLMVAWLSAANPPLPSRDVSIVNQPTTEPERDSDAQVALESVSPDDAAVPAADRSTRAAC